MFMPSISVDSEVLEMALIIKMQCIWLKKNIMLRSASYTDFFVLEDKIIQYIKLSSDKIRTSDWSVGVDETKSNIP